MALPPLLKRRAPDIADTRPAEGPDPQIRTRARRRLIGAAVLLVLGVIAFPILFESQPRPVPVDLPMGIPSRDNAAPLSVPGRKGHVVSGTIGETAPAAAAAPVPALPPGLAASMPAAQVQPSAGLPVAAEAPAKPSTPAAAASVPVAAAPPGAAPAVAAKPVDKPKPEARDTAKPADKPAAQAQPKASEKPADKPADKTAVVNKPSGAAASPTAEAKSARYVVQVGAYADEASAKDARARVERLGLKTFTQDVEVQGARRIRVRIGPFDSQDEAQRAVAALKAGKLPGVVLKL
jgi:DedD protein